MKSRGKIGTRPTQQLSLQTKFRVDVCLYSKHYCPRYFINISNSIDKGTSNVHVLYAKASVLGVGCWVTGGHHLNVTRDTHHVKRAVGTKFYLGSV